MKKLSIIFAAIAVILSDVMCAVVAFNYCDLLWGIKYAGYSAPADVAFYYAIPFLVAIAISVVLAVVLRKKTK